MVIDVTKELNTGSLKHIILTIGHFLIFQLLCGFYFQACTILLVLLFFYDIFFVFITPLITSVG